MNNDTPRFTAQGEMVAKSKKILITTTVPETLATILKDQPHYLSDYFQVSLVTSPGLAISEIIEDEKSLVHEVSMTRGISVAKDIVSVVRMVSVLQKIRPDLIHSYTPKAGLIAMLAGWLCRVPVRVHTFTGLIFPTSQGFRQQLLIWMDRLICACATHIVPEGQGVKKDLKDFRITRKPLQIIGYGNIAGVDTAYFSPLAPGVNEAAMELRKKLGIESQDFVFCFVGRLNKDKGIKELQIAFSELDLSAHLLLVGDMDLTAPIDTATVEAIKLHPRVHRLGFLSDIRGALRATDVLVLPSYREGFPNVVLQAGAMELPVIASDINGCNEVIEPEYNGWLVPPRDAKALGSAMHQAMHTLAATRSKMALKARARIQQRFERRAHWDRMVAFYQELLLERKKAHV